MNSVGGERHRLLPVAIAIVLPTEADFALVDGEKAVIGDGDAVGVSREVGQDLFGAAEGRFGVDAPFRLSGGSEVAAEGATGPGAAPAPAEGQLLGDEGLLQMRQETAGGRDETSTRTGRKKLRPASDPAAIGRETAAGNDAMQVRMMEQCLAPGVEHGEKAELGAEMLGIGGDRAQGLGGGVKQDPVDRPLFCMGDGGDLFRHGKDHVEIGRGQEFGSAGLQPAAPARDWHFGQCRLRHEL